MRIPGSGFAGGMAKRHPRYPREKMRGTAFEISGIGKRHPRYPRERRMKDGIGKRHPRYPRERGGRPLRSGMGIAWPDLPDWVEDISMPEPPGWWPKDWWWPGDEDLVIEPEPDPTAPATVQVQVTQLRSQAARMFGEGTLSGEEFTTVNDKLSEAAALEPYSARILLKEVAAFLAQRTTRGGGTIGAGGGPLAAVPWWGWLLLVGGGAWAAYRYL